MKTTGIVTLKDVCIENQAEKEHIYIHLTDVRADEYDPLCKTLWEGWLADIPDGYMNYKLVRTAQSLKDNENGINGFYLEIKEVPEDNHVNLFKKPMSEQEQLELSDKLDDFLQMYENGFADQLSGDVEDDADYLTYEFKALYQIVKMLEDRAIN